MRIAFIGGTGEEGMGLAYRFARAGHACVIGSRAIEKAQASVARAAREGRRLRRNCGDKRRRGRRR